VFSLLRLRQKSRLVENNVCARRIRQESRLVENKLLAVLRAVCVVAMVVRLGLFGAQQVLCVAVVVDAQ
jgi:hypothetical protein